MNGFSIIVATDSKGGIGKGNQIPWRLSADMQYFKEVTTRPYQQGKPNVVIMGRKTWESLPPKFRPLPDRVNVVLSRQTSLSLPPGVERFSDLETALDQFVGNPRYGATFVIGGGAVYLTAIQDPRLGQIHLTLVEGDFQCDTFFPDIPDSFQRTSLSSPHTEREHSFSFQVFDKKH